MIKKTTKEKKAVLLILDGWGLGKKDDGNAIHLAKTPFIDSLYKKYPWTKVCAHGKCAGLPKDQVGNSEAGHENIGAGKIVDQDVVYIDKDIKDGRFYKNPAFLAAINSIKKSKSNLHLMGMLSSNGSPHSNSAHLKSLIKLTRQKKVKNVYLHLFTDGRDSPPRSALKIIGALERFLKPNEIIATVIGRFYAMDRKKSWERTNWAYDAMLLGRGHEAKSPQEGITRAYNANVTDEFIEPIVMYQKNKMTPRIKNGDAIIFFNLRSDRARQFAKPFVQDGFEKMNPGSIKRKKVLSKVIFVAMTDFGPDLDGILTAYPSEDLKDTLPMLLKDKKQIYIAEKEKYAHVTYFFNGGYPDPIAGEERFLVSSPNVTSYDKKPAMSTARIVKKVISSITTHDFICANIACPDMIAHTGNLKAGIKAAEAVDKYVKKIYQVCKKKDVDLIITADHGNIEYMYNSKTGEVITEHTTNPVPFIVISSRVAKSRGLKKNANLGNIAPTIVKLLGVNIKDKDSII
jgi:2,3-bisphosphoglycerate-independent phosphoglycerate mutase